MVLESGWCFVSGILWEEAVFCRFNIYVVDCSTSEIVFVFILPDWLVECLLCFFWEQCCNVRAEPPREILEEHLLPFVYSVSSLTVVVSYMCSMVFFGWEAPSISKHVDFHSRFFFASSTRLKIWKQFLGWTSINVTPGCNHAKPPHGSGGFAGGTKQCTKKWGLGMGSPVYGGTWNWNILKSFKDSPDSPENCLLEDGLVCFWNLLPRRCYDGILFSPSVVASDTTMPHWRLLTWKAALAGEHAKIEEMAEKIQGQASRAWVTCSSQRLAKPKPWSFSDFVVERREHITTSEKRGGSLAAAGILCEFVVSKSPRTGRWECHTCGDARWCLNCQDVVPGQLH